MGLCGKAADVLEKRGLAKRMFHDPSTDAVCMNGALGAAATGEPREVFGGTVTFEMEVAQGFALSAIDELFTDRQYPGRSAMGGTHNLCWFNNHEDTTTEDGVRVWRRADELETAAAGVA